MNDSAGKERSICDDQGERAYHRFGSGPPVLFAGGLAGGHRAFSALIRHLSGRHACLAWNYRGLYDGTRAPLGISAHARDGLAILDAEGHARAAVIGWSCGVQVALSMFEQAPDRISMLVLINGGARASWGARPEAGPLRRLYPRLFNLMERAPGLTAALLRAAAGSPEVFTWGRRVGLLGVELEQDVFADVVRELARVDVLAMLAMLRDMEREDMTRVLARIDVPTLVIGGDRDPFTSRAALERLVNQVPGAEYLLLPGATHYAVLDHAQHVSLRIEKFFGERGYGADVASVRPSPCTPP